LQKEQPHHDRVRGKGSMLIQCSNLQTYNNLGKLEALMLCYELMFLTIEGFVSCFNVLSLGLSNHVTKDIVLCYISDQTKIIFLVIIFFLERIMFYINFFRKREIQRYKFSNHTMLSIMYILNGLVSTSH